MNYEETLKQLGIAKDSTLANDIEASTQAFDMVKEICCAMIETRRVKTSIFFIASIERMITSILDDQFSGFSELVAGARECLNMTIPEKEG